MTPSERLRTLAVPDSSQVPLDSLPASSGSAPRGGIQKDSWA